MTKRTLILVLTLILLLPGPTLSVRAETPQGTAFTYQGELHFQAARAQGSYDFRFLAFDTADDQTGTQLGEVIVENLAVQDGVFSTTLDFGVSPFAGNAVWLEISVREGASVMAFTKLLPRQRVTPTPYAVNALTMTNFKSTPLRIHLQEGLGGYAGTTDTTIIKNPSGFPPVPGTAGQIQAEFQTDEFTGKLALLRFDLLPVTAQVEGHMQQFNPGFSIADCSTQITVNSAHLHLLALAGGGASGTTPAYLLRYFEPTAPLFDELLADWDNANGEDAWDKSGASFETFHDLIGGVFDAKDMPDSSFGHHIRFVLEREIVTDWVCNPTTNKGMAIDMAGGGSGGSMQFFSRENVTANKPMLILDLTVTSD